MTDPEPYPRIQMAILCDFATVREGLLHVLGGGVSRIWRPRMPAPLGLTLAVLAEVAPERAQLPHEFKVQIVGPDEAVVADMSGGFGVKPGPRPLHLEEGEGMLIPAVVPLLNVGVGRHGAYTLSATLDDAATAVLRFWVLHPDEMSLPPLNLADP
ncbi:MAG: DUF6941 family protein [Acidimicrobiales bacterium]